MNQTASLSQTSESVVKSPTSQRLRQHPTAKEMQHRPTKFERLRNFSAISLLTIIVASLTLMGVHSCSDDVDRQHAAAVKHQSQFEGNK